MKHSLAAVSVAMVLFFALSGLLSVPCSATVATGEGVGRAADMVTRPDPDGTPTEVKVGLYVLDVADIDDVTQTFKVDFAVRLRWKDSRLPVQLGISEGEIRKISMDEIWNPHPLILNKRGLESELQDFVFVDSEGNVTFIDRFLGELGFSLRLHDFPFDEHRLPLSVISGRYGPDDVRFVVDEKITGEGEVFSIADWEILPGRVELGTYYFAPQHKNLAMFTYAMYADRRAGFFLWRVIAPLCIIIFMSWMVFYIDPNHLEAQVGVSATSVLTLVAFQFAVGVLLPRISYLTRMDIFVLLSSIMIFLALVEGVVTSGLASRGRYATALRIDKWCRVLFPVAFVLSLVGAYWL